MVTVDGGNYKSTKLHACIFRLEAAINNYLQLRPHFYCSLALIYYRNYWGNYIVALTYKNAFIGCMLRLYMHWVRSIAAGIPTHFSITWCILLVIYYICRNSTAVNLVATLNKYLYLCRGWRCCGTYSISSKWTKWNDNVHYFTNWWRFSCMLKIMNHKEHN